MRFHARKTFRVGPIQLHFTEHGFSSWGLHIWRWTWNATTGRHSVDTPGPGGVSTEGRRRRRGR